MNTMADINGDASHPLITGCFFLGFKLTIKIWNSKYWLNQIINIMMSYFLRNITVKPFSKNLQTNTLPPKPGFE
jgi:hypothetical protein